MALQQTVHDIDSGTIARILKLGMLVALLAGLCVVYLLFQFKGLGTEQGMDQAQIARSLISGEGFATRYIRPLAIQKLTDAGKKIPDGNFPEFYNAPLFPLLEAAALFPVKKHLDMQPSEVLGKGDIALASFGIILMMLGVLVWYFVGALLFDRPLALLAAGLLLVTDLMWQFALAALPQHLLIILFGLATLCAVKARRADEAQQDFQSLAWLGGAAFCFGLMSLTHGVTAFVMPGFLVFCFVGFHGRIQSLLLAFAVYLLTVSPWLVHNFLVCGNPLGLSIHAALAGAGVPESSLMRGLNTGLTLGGGMPTKFRDGLLGQASHLWEYLGLNVAAAAFLLALLHPFRNTTTSLWRWIVLMMWALSAVGMTLFGVRESVSGNQLHIVFLPVFVLYGMALILVLWNRLGIALKPLRIAFLCLVFLLAAAPMLLTLLSGQKARIQWPPYVPPFISVLRNWYGPREVLCSDMPWAVAWYANRKCLLLPDTRRSFNEISDYSTLGSPVVGLYLTPVSGQTEFLSLMKGPYKDWGPVIMRTVNLNDFPLKNFTPLPIDGECILYSDTARWAKKPGS